jgi:very-short-patch-repair endonuclease
MGRRLDFKVVKERFEFYGCVLISTEYKNNSELLDFICVCGKPNKISLNSLSSGSLCYECGLKKIIENHTLDYSYVKSVFVENGCELLSEIYIDSKKKLDYICNCGNPSSISFDNFKSGNRCRICRFNKTKEKLRLPFDEVLKTYENSNCKLLILESEYINNNTSMKFQCECGNISYSTLSNFKKGARCQDCANTKRRETMYQNDTAPRSTQQSYLSTILNGIVNYPVHTASLDIAFVEQKIYMEYDGSGHRMGIIFGDHTEESFLHYERSRKYALLRRGWKEIRIISRKDYIPQENKIIDMFKYATDYFLTNRHWIEFDIDNETVKTSQYEKPYDFGKLQTGYKIRKIVNAKEVS